MNVEIALNITMPKNIEYTDILKQELAIGDQVAYVSTGDKSMLIGTVVSFSNISATIRPLSYFNTWRSHKNVSRPLNGIVKVNPESVAWVILSDQNEK